MRRSILRSAASLSGALAHRTGSAVPSHISHIPVSISKSSPIPQILTYRAFSSISRRDAAVEAVTTEDVAVESEAAAPITLFSELQQRGLVHQNVVRSITRDMGLTTMTEVQSATINEALDGDDIIAQARTGTGKTMAFLIPTLQRLIANDPDLARSGHRRNRTTIDDIRAVIISPTRELAEQIATEAKRLTKNTSVIVQCAVGGTQKRMHLQQMKRDGCHILVGTPGRLNDIFSDSYSGVSAPGLQSFVLDEADRLLDDGFWPEIQSIMKLFPARETQDRQTLMFSATIPKEVVHIVRATLKPGFRFVRTVKEDDVPTHERVPQNAVTVRSFENSFPAFVELCSQALENSRKPGARPFKAIAYFPTTGDVALASDILRTLEEPNSAQPDAFGKSSGTHPFGRTRIFQIHAKLSQSQRTRAAENFRNCTSGILLSSDVTARGMDFPEVTHVIQLGLPPNRDQYIHRIGRTGRAGKEGESWLITTDLEQSEQRQRLHSLPLVPSDSLTTAQIDMTSESDMPAATARILRMVGEASRRVNPETKETAYRARLGVFAWLRGFEKTRFITELNNLTKFGWGMPEPPNVGGLLSKLGFSGGGGGGGGRRGGFGGGGFGGRSGGFGDRSSGGRSGGYGDRSEGGRSGGYGDRSSGSRSGGYGDREGGRSGGYGERSGGYGDRSSGGRGGGFGGNREGGDRQRAEGYGRYSR